MNCIIKYLTIILAFILINGCHSEKKESEPEHPKNIIFLIGDGMGINGGSFKDGTVEGGFTTGSHTGVMVPVFAYGPGAKEFAGIYENTALFDKFLQAYRFSK